jgi:hypothetical protein
MASADWDVDKATPAPVGLIDIVSHAEAHAAACQALPDLEQTLWAPKYGACLLATSSMLSSRVMLNVLCLDGFDQHIHGCALAFLPCESDCECLASKQRVAASILRTHSDDFGCVLC